MCFALLKDGKNCELKGDVQKSLALVTAQAFALYSAEKFNRFRRNRKGSKQKDHGLIGPWSIIKLSKVIK